jgi:hypothetical protein
MIARGYLDDRVVRMCPRHIGQVVRQHVADRFAAQLVRGAVGHGFIEHTGQRGIVLHVSGHDESDDLGSRQHREGFSGPVGDDYSGQSVLGQQAGSIEGIGVDGHDREVLGKFRGARIGDNTSGCAPARPGLVGHSIGRDLAVAA